MVSSAIFCKLLIACQKGAKFILTCRLNPSFHKSSLGWFEQRDGVLRIRVQLFRTVFCFEHLLLLVFLLNLRLVWVEKISFLLTGRWLRLLWSHTDERWIFLSIQRTRPWLCRIVLFRRNFFCNSTTIKNKVLLASYFLLALLHRCNCLRVSRRTFLRRVLRRRATIFTSRDILLQNIQPLPLPLLQNKCILAVNVNHLVLQLESRSS